MTRILGIVSGKGGVGKSTVTANLAYALTELGQDVIAMDTNLTTPHLGLHLGLHLAPRTLHDVLKGEENINNTIYYHPFGFRVIPASMNVNDLIDVDPDNLSETIASLNGKSDFVLMDCAPGLGKEAVSSINAAGELLLVTAADLPSVADALKTLKVAQELNKKVLGVVVNRVKNRRHELSTDAIENMLGEPVLVEIPEDEKIPESIAAKVSVIDYSPQSPASMRIRRLAHLLTGNYEYKEPREIGFFGRLSKWFWG